MPFSRRATAVLAVLGAIAMIGGCGGDAKAGGFCSEIKTGHAAFDSIEPARSGRALREFDRIAAKAPEPVASDLKTVSEVLSLLYNNPKAVAKEGVGERFIAALNRVDQYLRQTCGARIPRRVPLLGES